MAEQGGERSWMVAGYWLLIVALLSSATFFAVTVEGRRRQWRPSDGLVVESGTEVVALDVIDGDELAVRAGTEVFVVRLLGIKAFDAKANDPVVSGLGLEAEQGLRAATLGKLRVVYDEYKQDRAKRVLAYLESDDGDVGQRLVSEGKALVFLRYPFSREAPYLAAESKARSRAEGLWGNPKAAMRAMALGAAWKAQRDDD